MKEKYMPVKEYALLKECSVQHIYNLIKRGKLESKKIGTYTLVKLYVDPINLNNDFYRSDDVLAEILLDSGFIDFTNDIDKRKGKRTFSIKKKGRYIKLDYINISIFDDFGCNIFYATKISKLDLIQKLNYLTYKS